MKKYLIFFLLFTASFKVKSQYAASNFTLISVINPEPTANNNGAKYSGCWGWYQQNKNKEYAIACSQSGTYWVDVTNPATPTVSAYRTGSVTGATWREVKTYLNYCYVVSDDGGSGNNSFQIFDMQYLPDSVSKVYDSKALFKRGHALWVTGNKLYVASVTYSNNSYSSMNVYSLANPVNPSLIRKLDQDYSFINTVHDMYVRNDTVYASCGYQGLYVFKLTATGTFSLLGSLTSYPNSGYNHYSALTPNGQTLVFADEVPNGLPIKVANVSNLSNIQVLASTNQFPATTPHNPFMVSNQYCFVSSYQEGLQLYDISNPAAPFLAGYFDTYYQGGGNTGNWGSSAYEGQWGAYPYFPSKNIFALDMQNGVFMLKTALYQNPQVVPGFTLPLTICPDKTITLTNTSTGAETYTWAFSTGTPVNPNALNSSVSFSATGIYSITLSGTNPSYSASLTRTIAVANVTAAISVTNAACNICATGLLKVVPESGTAPYTYTWLPSGGNASLAINLVPKCYTVSVKDANGCTWSGSKCVSLNIGIESIGGSIENITLSPNPADHILSISYPGHEYKYTVCDQLGRLVKANPINYSNAILSVEDLSPGIYFLDIESLNVHVRKKIIIEH
jgi:choice-of-anchor B domain-containing protein